MPYKHEIAEQVALERECIRCGIDKLHSNTRHVEEREYASASVYGCSSIMSAQAAIAEAIRSNFNHIRSRNNGVLFAEIIKHLNQFEDEQQSNILANIALKRTFDTVFSRRHKGGKSLPNTINNLTVNIGTSVEAECQMRWYEDKNPLLYERIKTKYWLSTTGTQQKQTVMKLMMNREDHHWDTWSASLRARLGGWLFDIVATTTGWFEKDYVWSGKGSTTIIVPSDAYLKIQQRLMQDAELFAPLAYPMLIEPNDWTNDRPGGYLLNEVQRGHKLVRKGNDILIQPDIPLDFLNKLQKVAYKINPFIYDVAIQLEERGHKLESFKVNLKRKKLKNF